MSKNNEKIKLHISEDFYIKFAKKHLLLDTCVFIDVMSHEAEFGEFFKNCKEQNITIVTISPVVFEFTKGAENSSKLKNKGKFISDVAEHVLPFNNNI